MKPPRPPRVPLTPRSPEDPRQKRPRPEQARPVGPASRPGEQRVPTREPVTAPRPVAAAKAPVDAAGLLGSERNEESEIAERRRERKRAKQRVRRRFFLGGVGAVLLICVMVWGFWFSPLFAVRDGSISVRAQSGYINLEPIKAVAAKQIGHPLPRVNTGAVERQILEDPAIATAAVSKEWPGGLSVVVTPREAVFALSTANGYQLVGADGVIIRQVEQAPEGLFVVKVTGDKMTPTIAAEAQELWGVLGKSVRDQTTAVSVVGDQFALELSGGAQVLWGSSADAETKGKVLTLLMEERAAKVYDITNPVRPSVR